MLRCCCCCCYSWLSSCSSCGTGRIRSARFFNSKPITGLKRNTARPTIAITYRFVLRWGPVIGRTVSPCQCIRHPVDATRRDEPSGCACKIERDPCCSSDTQIIAASEGGPVLLWCGGMSYVYSVPLVVIREPALCPYSKVEGHGRCSLLCPYAYHHLLRAYRACSQTTTIPARDCNGSDNSTVYVGSSSAAYPQTPQLQ